MRNPLVLFWEWVVKKVGEAENIIITYCGTVLVRLYMAAYVMRQ